MKKAQYNVVNSNGNLIKAFGADYKAACLYAKQNERCGLMYGLRVTRYYVTA